MESITTYDYVMWRAFMRLSTLNISAYGTGQLAVDSAIEDALFSINCSHRCRELHLLSKEDMLGWTTVFKMRGDRRTNLENYLMSKIQKVLWVEDSNGNVREIVPSE